MTFAALLTRELRQRLRRERSIWVIIAYLLVLGLLGFLFLQQLTSNNNRMPASQIGGQLYALFAVVQLLLIMFIAPAFTATTINGEKERQTFDLLLCSRLSAFSLLAGKLVAGLATALLLIAASAPFFSLIFFFGGVSPTQVLSAIVVFVATALMTGMVGLFFSTLLRRPPVSTALAYVFCVAWVLTPWLLAILLRFSFIFGPSTSPVLAWNPIVAIVSTFTYTAPFASYTFGPVQVAPWIAYLVLNLVATALLFLISMRFVKPIPAGRSRRQSRKQEPGTTTKAPVTA